VLVGGVGNWALMNEKLESTYNLAGKSNAVVLEILNRGFEQAKTPGNFKTAITQATGGRY
jgi:hypothetical protein